MPPLTLIIPGCSKAVPPTATDIVLAALVPQVFTALTLNVPPVVPEVTVIEFDEDDPDQPEGKVQV